MLDRLVTLRAALIGIIAMTALTVLVSGLVMRVLAPRDFPTVGTAIWWAAQTVTTVGYGDVAPRHSGGRVVAIVVMLQGVAFISVFTAAVTSTLVERGRRRPGGNAEHAALMAALARLDERLERVERTLADDRRR